ncbi:MAG: redoxin domain-containing protein [Cyclobacteriaceae bacterium]
MKKLILFLLVATSGYAQAQTTIQNFTLTNVVNEKPFSLDQCSSLPAVVVLFMGNECPYDNYYKDRIKQLIDSYAGKVQFLLVNSYDDPQETPEKMAIHYTDLGVPYLADKDQTVMENFGARKSPEAFLIKPTSGKFSIVYSGAIDDNPQVATDTKQNYLKDAIDKVLAGQSVEAMNNRVMGCTIRKK